jgi:broad specificity phosphatase PhoE
MVMLLRLTLVWFLSLGLLAQDSVVVILRHAEKASKRTNAELNTAGRRRAQRLVEPLAGFQPTALFASDLRRTQQTLEPLARRLGLPLQRYTRGSEGALGRALRADYAGRTVVVCGHSDTLMDLVSALGHSEPFPEINGFDRYWVLRVAERTGTVTLEEHHQAP